MQASSWYESIESSLALNNSKFPTVFIRKMIFSRLMATQVLVV